MSKPTSPDETNDSGKATFVLPQPTLSPEEFAQRIAEIRRKREDPEYIAYVERGRQASTEYRREIEEQERRWLDEEGK
jgi:hypothetical protein